MTRKNLQTRFKQLVEKNCRMTVAVRRAMEDLLDEIEDAAKQQPRYKVQQEVSVAYDYDLGWIVQEPVGDDYEYQEPDEPGTKRMAIELGRDIAKAGKMPLYIFTKQGVLERVEVPK